MSEIKKNKKKIDLKPQWDITKEVIDKLKESAKVYEEKREVRKELDKLSTDWEKEMKALNKKLEKIITNHNEKTWDKCLIAFTAVTDKWITKRAMSWSKWLTRIDEVFLANATAWFVLWSYN